VNPQSEQTVFIVDDEPSVRRAVRLILESAGHSIQEFESAVDFLESFDKSLRGCIVSDVRMPKLDGIKFLSRLNDACSQLPVLILTGHADVPMAVKAMKLGAADLLEKPVDPDELRSKVAKALVVEELAFQNNLEAKEIETWLATLSPRETEVMDLLVSGKQPKLIAEILGTAQSTIRIQRQSILKKMQADNVSDLIRLAGKIGRLED
jgi:two-component system response regulator FixJ